jgi:phage protein D
MAETYQIMIGGQPADADLYTALTSVEVEENMDLPGAVQLNIPVNRSPSGDLTYVSDPRFEPLTNLAVVVTPASGTSGGLAGAASSALGSLIGGGGASAAQCIFDGYILSQKLHLEKGLTNSTLAIWGQDASWLMNLEEKVKEWLDVTDADVANAIFGDYGITPADDNTADDSPSHTEDGHSLMQRGSDIQFLRTLARRNGKICRVACADQPGQRTGYFATPSLDGDPVLTLSLDDPVSWPIDALNLEWDVTRPTSVIARQALFTDDDENGVTADTSDSGLTSLGDRALADFAGQPMTVMLAAPVDDGGELTLRAQALLRDADWFVRCEGEADAARLNAILRAGTVVEIDGIGALHSGKYYVWSVRHTITADSHKMKFVLLRNAVGPAPSGGAGGLSALVGAL